MANYDRVKIAAMSVAERHQLHKNAKSAKSIEGDSIARLIEEAGLPFSESGGLNYDDPLVLRLYEIIRTPDGVNAALASQSAGRPPYEGVEPLLIRALGLDFGPHNMTTNHAGRIVAELMAERGFKKVGEGDLVTTCVAKTAATFAPKS